MALHFILSQEGTGSRSPRSAIVPNACGALLKCSGLSDEDKEKVLFTKEALASDWPEAEKALPPDVVAALVWCNGKTPAQLHASRLGILERIERRAGQIISSGELQTWRGSLPDHVQAVAGSVNGPLLKELLEECGWGDIDVVQLFEKDSAARSLAQWRVVQV